MASKFMVDSAFKARLLLRPSHPRTVSFGITYKLGCLTTGRPMWPLVLGSKAYSGSSSTLPLPKDQSSQSSKHKVKNWFFKTWNRISPWLKGKAILLISSSITTSTGFLIFGTRELWFPDWYKKQRRVRHESARESAIFEMLKKGPEFPDDIEAAVSRENLVKEVKKLITATEKSRLYPLIIGEHGTGKTSLIQLTINSMDKDKPKGIAYVDIPLKCRSEVNVAMRIQEGLGWKPDPVLDSNKPASVEETLNFFSRVALKYRQEYKQIPVLIIDNVNRLTENNQELLDVLQDYAKFATDRRRATVVFVSSEGCVPRLMTERSSWSRKGKILEVDDMSKEEAFQYLQLRGLNKDQITQSYELVGGRIMHLKAIADKIQEDPSSDALQVSRQELFSEAICQLGKADMLPGDRYHGEGTVIIHKLLEKGSIPAKTYRGLVDVSVGKRLLETNVLAFHVNSQEVSFQSTVMKRFCEANQDLWERRWTWSRGT